ncbi:divalent-cation tolerance protein CutA [Rhodopirellula sp. SWK7]|uniref:divalent-cation tolerance protein CutA n=1 Tax=Rhodopirellula sp. SWK7 TaxID=595460 RepID=UPI0002C016FC|nr:divalent-cation tolerance protein CutA [Rhodopirellula sp. SWK7]EMI42818.1 Divalent ion tolerance protein, CutA1 [Rhodopirellula sp. SWK7]
MPENNPKTDSLVIVWTTVADQDSARRLASSMLENRLAACVQIDSAIESHYRWEGRLHVDQEFRLIIKTRASLSSSVVHWLTENHPYDEPQILVTPVTEATPGYAAWVVDQTGSPG